MMTMTATGMEGGVVVAAEYQQWVHSCCVDHGMIIWRHKYPRITIFVVVTVYSV
jgi:hypothetical protein